MATIHHWAQALGFVRGSASRLWLRVTLGLLNTDVENPIVLRSENGLHSWDMFNVHTCIYIYMYIHTWWLIPLSKWVLTPVIYMG